MGVGRGYGSGMQERESTQAEKTMKNATDKPIYLKLTDPKTKVRFAKAMKDLRRGPKNLAEHLINMALDALER